MKTSNTVRAHGIHRFIALAATLCLMGVSFPVHAVRGLNRLQGISTAKKGAVTKIYLQLKSKPTFTVYRLERPTRVIVDLANTSVKGYEDPVDVDSWAVRSVAVARFSHSNSTITRVVIGFKRPSSYSVKARKNGVVVTVTAHSAPPRKKELTEAKKEALRAKKEAQRAKQAARRAQERALREKKRAKRVRLEAQQAKSQAQQAKSQAQQAKSQAQQAKSQAQQAKSQALKAQSQMEQYRRRLHSAQAEAESLRALSKKTAQKLAKMRSKLNRLQSQAAKAHQRMKKARRETLR